MAWITYDYSERNWEKAHTWIGFSQRRKEEWRDRVQRTKYTNYEAQRTYSRQPSEERSTISVFTGGGNLYFFLSFSTFLLCAFACDHGNTMLSCGFRLVLFYFFPDYFFSLLLPFWFHFFFLIHSFFFARKQVFVVLGFAPIKLAFQFI